MKIAICDDDKIITGDLEQLILTCFEHVHNQVECETYFSGETLIATIDKGEEHYQMYFLDIEMGGITGLDVAKQIRLKDDNAVIIFITSHGELMQEAFEVSAFHFLTKPLDHEKVQKVILRAYETLKQKKAIIQFTVRKKIYTLFFEQIEYFESNKRKVIINLYDGSSYEYYGTMKEVGEKVPQLLFVQVHNSYIINMDGIQSVDGEGIELKSGIKIMLTQKFKRDFQIAYRNYIIMRMG